jgi:crotonobetainyl-CoA:carnitine CoA-transferase CaiB-like acyl-CoA transferase
MPTASAPPTTRYAFNRRNTKHGFGFYDKKADAQAIGEELDALIDERNEHVTHEEVLARARKRDSAMHDVFTWSDPDAAEKWRRREAKSLISHIHIQKNKRVTKTRAFVFVNHPEHGGKRVLLSHRSAWGRTEFREQVTEQGVKYLRRTLKFFSDTYGRNPALSRLAKDATSLRKRVEREHMAAL